MEKRLIDLTLLFLMILTCAACSPSDQQTGTPAGAGQTASAGSTEILPDTSGTETSGLNPEQATSVPLSRGAQLQGSQVVSAMGENLGQVEQFFLGPQSVVEYVLVSLDGRFVPVPLTAFFWEDIKGILILRVDPPVLRNAPSISNAQDFDPTAEGWDTEVVNYWTNYFPVSPPSPIEVDNDLPPQASSLYNNNVVTAAGERLGEVEEVALMPVQGSPFIVVRTGEAFIPIPWGIAGWDALNQQVVFTQEVGLFRTAPGFESVQALEQASPDQQAEIESYWESVRK